MAMEFARCYAGHRERFDGFIERPTRADGARMGFGHRPDRER